MTTESLAHKAVTWSHQTSVRQFKWFLWEMQQDVWVKVKEDSFFLANVDSVLRGHI